MHMGICIDAGIHVGICLSTEMHGCMNGYRVVYVLTSILDGSTQVRSITVPCFSGRP